MGSKFLSSHRAPHHSHESNKTATGRRRRACTRAGLEKLEGRIFLSADMVGCGCALCAASAMSAGQATQQAAQPVVHALKAGKGASAMWRPLSDVTAVRTSTAQAYIKPNMYTPFGINDGALKKALAGAPMEFTAAARSRPVVLSLPTPTGGTQRFRIVESPVMEPGLAAKFPGIKTYSGQGIDDPSATVRLDYTYLGFHAQVLSPNGAFYIDPYWHTETSAYISYYKRDLYSDKTFECLTPPGSDAPADEPTTAGGPEVAGTQLRTYQLAVSTTGEYTAFFGGAGPALAAVTTTVNRITGIFENDAAVRMVLIANNNLLIFPTASTDPFTNPTGNPSLANTQNQTYVDANIGSANYDIGHVFHRVPSAGSNNGIVGQIGSVGQAGVKAQGFSSTNNPVGDAFDIDYAAHEMGHQFGGRHNFNNCGGGQGDSSSLAQEPGSGSTIMSYAGICGGTNLQAHSDPYFSALNASQIQTYTQTDPEGNGAADITATGNSPPTVSAGPVYTIPAFTPFTLTATGSDPDGDPLTFNWEQRNGGGVITVGTDPGSGPILRGWSATSSPSRTFPRLSNLLNNTTPFGETLPQTSRTMSFSVMARDNRANGGGSQFSFTSVTSVNTGGGFAVTSPNGVGQTLTGGSNFNFLWNVAGTTANGINTANVNILLSLDGGNTFPITLASATANDGSESIQLPFNTGSATARIKIEAVGNIFFDINNFNFTLTNVPSISAPLQPALLAAFDTGISNSDRITRLNNSSGGSTLQFSVDGTIPGANVNLYANGTLIGTALASGSTTVVTTNGSAAMADGLRSITARNQQGANPESTDSPALSVTVDTVAPTLASPTNFVYATQPHKLVYSFSEDVSATLDNADVAVTTDPGGSPVTTTFSYNGGLNQGTYDFGGVLADGDYLADLTGAGVTDVAGNPMSDSTDGFFFMMADANHDRHVNSDDFNLLATNFGFSPRDFTQGDFTYDGQVNSDDFNELATRFGNVLGPVGITAAAVASPPRAGSIRTATGTPAASLRAAPSATGSLFSDLQIDLNPSADDLRTLLPA